MREVVDLHDQQRCLALVPSRCRCRSRHAWLAALLAPALLGGCVSPPPRVNQAAETRAANDPVAMLRIADAAAASGDEATAASFYGRAAALQPGNVDIALGYARALASQGRIADAVAALQAAMPQTSGNGTRRLSIALGRLLILSNRPTEAVAAFQQALADAPNTPALLIGLGVALDASRDHAAAQAAYRHALAIEPTSIAARNDLALSTALQGNTGAALVSLRRVRNRVAEAGGQASDLATIDGNLALVYAMRGNLRRAGEVGVGAAPDARDLAGNMQFYSELAAYPPLNGAADSSGLAGAAPTD